MLEGEVVLVEDGGETVLKAGDAAGWKAGVANGHCLVNASSATRSISKSARALPRESAHYPDIDLLIRRDDDKRRALHPRRIGEPY